MFKNLNVMLTMLLFELKNDNFNDDYLKYLETEK